MSDSSTNGTGSRNRSKSRSRIGNQAVCLLVSVRCLLLSAFCLLPHQPADAAVISRAAEISLGRGAAQEYENSASIDSDPVLATRVRRIGQRLIAAAGGSDYPFEFHAVETNGINAFALPGGFVYIYRGLAQLVPGDDALAFILAHEISHVTRRHGVRQIEKSLAVYAVLDFALGQGTASALLQLMIDMHYSRQDESEADRLGLEMMVRAGYDATQGAEAMAVVARAAKSGRSIPALLRSHPLPESRIAALRQQAAALQAAPRPKPRLDAAPPLPASAPLPAPPAAPTVSELFPLQVGMRWTYRMTGAPDPRRFTVTVQEELPEHPGVFRLRTELDDSLAISRMVTVSADGIATYPLANVTAQSPARRETAWEVEIPLAMVPPGEVRNGDWETIRVPAGEFRALRTGQSARDGAHAATVWLAPGVGIVRRSWERTGLTEELESVERPAPEDSNSQTSPQKTQGAAEKEGVKG